MLFLLLWAESPLSFCTSKAIPEGIRSAFSSHQCTSCIHTIFLFLFCLERKDSLDMTWFLSAFRIVCMAYLIFLASKEEPS